MKIGQITIDLHFNSEIGKFYVSASPEEVQQGTQFTGKVKNSTAPEAVQLDPESDDFEEKKSELKAAGYFYNRYTKTWRKKKGTATADANGSQKPAELATGWYGDATEITLSQDDENFEEKKTQLKAAGFRWDNKAKTWHKETNINGSRKSVRNLLCKVFLLSAVSMFAGM